MNLNPDKITHFTSGGREYTLYYGMKALREFELETNQSIMVVFKRDSIGINSLAILIKCGLVQAHSGITIDDVDAICDDVGIDNVLDFALDALSKGLAKVGNPKAPLTELALTNGATA